MLSVTGVLAGGPENIPVMPDYFTGFFIGGAGSLHVATFDVDASTTVDPLTLSGTFPDLIQVSASSGTVYTSSEPGGGSGDGFGGVQGGLEITIAHQFYLVGQTPSTAISGQTSATAAATLYAFQGAVNFYFGQTWF